MFIIKDDFSNVLQYNNKFNFGSYGCDIGVPKLFKSFDDAVEFLGDNIDEFTIEEIE